MIRVLLLLGLVTGEALAQVASATLSGIVLDESADAVIPGLYKSVGAQDENDFGSNAQYLPLTWGAASAVVTSSVYPRCAHSG